MQEKRANHQMHIPTAQIALDEKVSFLARTPIFQSLQTDEIQAITHLITMTSCMQGRILYNPGEQCSSLFWLKSGSIQIYHLSTDGRKLITQAIEPGDCFGAIPTYGDSNANLTYTTFAEAVSNSELYVMSREDMEHILQTKPGVTNALLIQLRQRLLAVEEQLTATTFQSVTTRLAALLLQLAQPRLSGQTKRSSGKSSLLTIEGFSHADLADRLGVYRETVSTALRELKEAGTIEPGRKRIIIRQPARLQDLADNGSKTRSIASRQNI